MTTPTPTIEEVLAGLVDVKREGREWRALCPIHGGHALTVTESDDGKVLAICRAGCDQRELASHLGLRRNGNGTKPEPVKPTIYHYVDENGHLLFQVVRKTGKRFRQRRPDSDGGWAWSLGDVRRVLYNLPDVLDAARQGGTVWVVEGEKDAEAVGRTGEVGTCNPGGAGKWRKEYGDSLRGAHVVVVADKDEPGYRHAYEVATSLEGVAASVRMVEAATGKDAADHLAAGHGLDEFVPLLYGEEAEEAMEAFWAEVGAYLDGGAVLVEHERTAPSDDWPVMDEAAFYGLAGQVVRTISPHSEADPVALLLDFLVSFGSAVGAAPYARAEAAKHHPRLFTVIVGKTSKARKGSSRTWMRYLFERADPEWSKKCQYSGLASGEGLIAAMAPKEDDEGGADLPDHRAFIHEAEFARLLVAAARDGSTLAPIIRDAWDTGDLQVMTRRNPLKAEGAHVSLLAHITEEELRAKLSSVEIASGTANRFLFGCVRRKQRLAFGGDLDPEAERALATRVGHAIADARALGRIEWDESARALWQRLYDEMADDDPPGLVGPLTARAEAQTLRLALTYALLDGSATIRREHLEAGWAVWSYCRASVERLFGTKAQQDEAAAMASELLTRIRAAGDRGMTDRDIDRAYHLDRNPARAPVVAMAKDHLRREGAVRLQDVSAKRQAWVAG